MNVREPRRNKQSKSNYAKAVLETSLVLTFIHT